MKILVSPNSFKGTLSARKSAAAICAGLKKSELNCECIELPIADGGDGSLVVAANYLDAEIRRAKVKDPSGRKIRASFGWNEEQKSAIVELAEASGLQLLNNHPLHPMSATTFGTGQLIQEALQLGAKKVYLMLGGSATIDGAIGILDALGVVFKSRDGIVISNPLPTDLYLISEIDTSEVDDKLNGTEIIVLCDVKNVLLGNQGAAAVFGPQKGANDEEVETLEKGLSHFADVIEQTFGVDVKSVKHGGSAGGVAAVLHGVLGAKLVDGARQILNWAGFDQVLQTADIVITAEGQIDKQTNYGKGPGLVVKKAKEAGKITVGLSGSVKTNDMHFKNFDLVLPIVNAPENLSIAFANTSKNLRRTAFQLGQFLHALDKNNQLFSAKDS